VTSPHYAIPKNKRDTGEVVIHKHVLLTPGPGKYKLEDTIGKGPKVCIFYFLTIADTYKRKKQRSTS
jgi:hypothetical protein